MLQFYENNGQVACNHRVIGEKHFKIYLSGPVCYRDFRETAPLQLVSLEGRECVAASDLDCLRIRLRPHVLDSVIVGHKKFIYVGSHTQKKSVFRRHKSIINTCGRKSPSCALFSNNDRFEFAF